MRQPAGRAEKAVARPAAVGVPVVGRDALTPESVLDAAQILLETEGLEALTMRRLATELGVRTPTLYWHVGGREEILHRLIERITETLGNVRPEGETPAERITFVCTALLTAVRQKPQLVALSRTVGRGEAIFTGAQELVVQELSDAGLRGHEAAFALRSIFFHLGGFMLIEHATSGSLRGAKWWRVGDNELREELAHGGNLDDVFRFTLGAIVEALLPARHRGPGGKTR